MTADNRLAGLVAQQCEAQGIPHANCRQCHPELGRDYLRAGVWLGALAISLATWIVGIAWLATRWN